MYIYATKKSPNVKQLSTAINYVRPKLYRTAKIFKNHAFSECWTQLASLTCQPNVQSITTMFKPSSRFANEKLQN